MFILKNLRNRVGEKVDKRNIHLVILWIIFAGLMFSYLNVPMYVGRIVNFETVYHKQMSRFHKEEYLVINDKAEFEEF